MPSSTKRFRMEPESDESLAHENAESSSDEIREGSESEEASARPRTSRRRSARGAKQTKAPMDGEGCGCGGGRAKKCTCDSGCSSYGKKMDRNDALTPQEYLAACDLGIQGRSRSYIRARLDAAERLDLKCGNGAISQGEKCTKGTAQSAPNQAQGTKRNSRRRVAGNVLTAVGTIGNLATAAGAAGGLASGNSAALSKALQRQAAFSALTGAGQHLAASGTANQTERRELRAVANTSLGMAALGGVAGHKLGGGYTKGLGAAIGGLNKPNFSKAAANIKGRASVLRGNLTQKRTRISLERMYNRPGRRDSVYAAGFSPELDQLAI